MTDQDPGPDRPGPQDLETTLDLLERTRAGDSRARERLVSRFLPILRNWATGRLPGGARDLAETDDLVQITLVRALDHIDRFEHRGEGAFLAYLRRILLNSMRDEIRRTSRRPAKEVLSDRLDDPGLVVQALGSDTIEAYEKALATLPEVQQQAVMLRIEFGYSHQEIAQAIGSPSANAARMMITRALVRLAEVMDE